MHDLTETFINFQLYTVVKNEATNSFQCKRNRITKINCSAPAARYEEIKQLDDYKQNVN